MHIQSVDFIRSYCCFDPVTGEVLIPPGPEKPGKYIPEGWTGTALDVLNIRNAAAKDLVQGVLIVKGWFTDGERKEIETRLIDLFPVNLQNNYLGGINLFTISAHLSRHYPYEDILSFVRDIISTFTPE